MIPKNTKIVTREMIRQLEIEQTEILKELQLHHSWFNTIQFQFIGVIDKLKFTKKQVNSEYYLNKISS